MKQTWNMAKKRWKKMSSCGENASGLLEELVADLHGFSGSAEQFDDITLLAIRRNS